MDTYTLIRSNRKTAAIHIINARVEVRVPHCMPQEDIDLFLYKKEQWIREKLAIQQQHITNKSTFEIDYGSNILILGKDYPIVVRNGIKAGFDGNELYMPPGMSPTEIKDMCKKIYRGIAKKHLPNRVAVFAQQMGIAPTAIKITSAKTRWGSCSNRKSINFSWRLIMADDNTIDYVVVHELAHLKEMNHSLRFWAVVQSILPDYKQRQQSLKTLQRRIAGENWD